MLSPKAYNSSDGLIALIAGFGFSLIASIFGLGVLTLSRTNLELDNFFNYFRASTETQTFIDTYIPTNLILFCFYFGYRLRRTTYSALFCGSMLLLYFAASYCSNYYPPWPGVIRCPIGVIDLLFLIFSATAPIVLAPALGNDRVKIVIQLSKGLCAAVVLYASVTVSIFLCLLLNINFFSFIAFVVRQAFACALYYFAMNVVVTPSSERLVPKLLINWSRKLTLSKAGLILLISMILAGFVWSLH